MKNRTVINPALKNNSTVINKTAQAPSATEINTAAEQVVKITPGTTFNGKYKVTSKMNVNTGEADLYVCRYRNQDYVAKVYRRTFAVKSEVIDVLKKIASPNIARLYDTGTYNGLPFEILPYYKLGSLQGKKIYFDLLKRHIIPNLNEGLNKLHQSGVIHKDLKPSNVMLCDNGKDVAIIDFGISSVKNDGNTVIVTQTGMTPEYSAPETFRNLYLAESDYYSLGITLFELFCGYTPYRNMDAEAIEQFIAVQRIPFPKEMPKELSDLIAALTYYDITNRKNKQNPNRRWTYTEVKRWCKGEKLPIPGEGIGIINRAMPPYTFLGKAYVSIPDLVAALATNWKEGKKQLFRGLLSGFFKGFNPELAGFCLDAENEASKGSKDDFVFWKLLYKLHPETKAFFWQGAVFQGLPALGRSMLEELWKNDENRFPLYQSILSEKLLSAYVAQADPKNNMLIKAAAGLEDAFIHECSTKRDILKHYYLTAYMLSGQKLLRIDGQEFRTVGELAEYMKSLLDDSYERFEEFCHRMIDYDDNLDVQLEAWLIALGKRKELENWRRSLAE